MSERVPRIDPPVRPSGDWGGEFELVTLRGGTNSIRSNTHGETMHIGSDPSTEALDMHVRQQRLAERALGWTSSDPFVIWDIGLGPGANAITAIVELGLVSTPVELHSFEISTAVMEFALQHAESLGYLGPWKSSVRQLLDEGVSFPFPHIRWQLHRGDFSSIRMEMPAPAVIFFDPYSPMRNPEMWSLETFSAIWKVVSNGGAPPCTMTNYTRSTSARVTMMLAGWFVGTGVPTGEKNETTIASNSIDLLERPLDCSWIDRVKASTNSGPIRRGILERFPIGNEDLKSLISHPQFRLRTGISA